MTAELTDLDGVGPARSESMVDAGYESVADIAEADPEQLAEDISVPEDTALGFVVEAENTVAEEEAEVEEEEPQSVTEEIEEAVSDADEASEDESNDDEGEASDEEEDAAEDEPEAPEEDDGPEEYPVSIELETALEYDTFFAAVMREREAMLGGNRTGTELFDYLLDSMRSADVGDEISFEATANGLNELHNAVRKLVVEYQGDNLIDHMNALKAVQEEVNNARAEYLF